ncbi:hypothetical protein RvY_16234 [Ramazzottius varieornatus]|uniref:Uncharacterized protein n=1 Tax=Ramazzottius varieornatus TaxID=947166 RepID=A0A1D1VXR5_RAMVA|nr:hypothetical protein RvY_16234 [Ramazzottius varieornatus]
MKRRIPPEAPSTPNPDVPMPDIQDDPDLPAELTMEDLEFNFPLEQQPSA